MGQPVNRQSSGWCVLLSGFTICEDKKSLPGFLQRTGHCVVDPRSLVIFDNRWSASWFLEAVDLGRARACMEFGGGLLTFARLRYWWTGFVTQCFSFSQFAKFRLDDRFDLCLFMKNTASLQLLMVVYGIDVPTGNKRLFTSTTSQSPLAHQCL
jgi:hypothetical protein